jgi:hypothetical protein
MASILQLVFGTRPGTNDIPPNPLQRLTGDPLSQRINVPGFVLATETMSLNTLLEKVVFVKLTYDWTVSSAPPSFATLFDIIESVTIKVERDIAIAPPCSK